MTGSSTPFSGAQRLLTATPKPSRWVFFSLLLIFVAYWIFARALERPDLTLVVRDFWQTWLPALPLPSFVIFFAEMLHPRVLRHLVPLIVGWVLAQRAAVSMVHLLYEMPDRKTAADFLRRLQSNSGVAVKPVEVSAAQLNLERHKSVLLRIGGPGAVKIPPAEVAVTELNGRFLRVLGPGKHDLQRFETIYAVLDLRTQERSVTAVSLFTKDGINLHTDLQLTFRVHSGGKIPTPDNPYPYDPQAVRSAAYAQSITTDNRVVGWDTLPERLARAKLAQLIRSYRLDELIHLPREAEERHYAIQQRLLTELRTQLPEKGIELLNLFISPWALPEEVVQQNLHNWQIDWEVQRNIQNADSKAVALEEMELARAEAEITMVQAIVEGVQRARREGRPANMSEIMALRLIDALEQMARQAQPLYPTPFSILPRLQAMRQQLVPPPIIAPQVEE